MFHLIHFFTIYFSNVLSNSDVASLTIFNIGSNFQPYYITIILLNLFELYPIQKNFQNDMSLCFSEYLIQKFKGRSALRELSLFLNKNGPVWLTVQSLCKQLKNENIDYAVIGGLAVYIHGYERTTHDCDILLAKAVNLFY